MVVVIITNVATMTSYGKTKHDTESKRYLFVIPQDDLGILFWERMCYVDTVYTDEYTNSYSSSLGTDVTTTTHRVVYGGITSFAYDGDVDFFTPPEVEYSSFQSDKSVLLKTPEPYIKASIAINRGNSNTIKLYGDDAKGETAIVVLVPDAIIPTFRIDMSLDLN